MSNNKIGIGGDLEYLKFLVGHYGGNTEVGSVAKREQERLSTIQDTKITWERGETKITPVPPIVRGGDTSNK